jgi:hypothetical protein
MPMPAWVNAPNAGLDQRTYVAAVGSGNSRETAEGRALGNLVGIFSREIQIDERVIESYQEIIRGGATASWSESTERDSVIAMSARFDTLVGAEIGERWDNGRDFHAAAFINIPRAIQTYSDMVNSNRRMIDNLITIPAADRSTLEAFSRFQLAATVADMTSPFINLLSTLGAPPVQGFRTGDELRVDALEITRSIPVNIQVRNDRSDRIQGAFRRSLSELGFQSGGVNSRYRLNVDVIISPVEIAGNPNRFSRIELTANLEDTVTRTVLLPFNFNLREGHTSQSEADNRAIMLAERRIGAEYADLLREYLSRLLP